MEKGIIRVLRPEEIEVRVSMVNDRGVTLLLYKDARVDQRILDETFGPFGWKRSHQCIEGNLYCTVEIFDRESKEWVAKQDVGSTGYTEKEKSQASDSFKRACFNWGIGRELYSAPFIWVPANKVDIREKDGRFVCNDRFRVGSISYSSNREITGLEIMNKAGALVYSFSAGAAVQGDRKPEEPKQQASVSVDSTGAGVQEKRQKAAEQEQRLRLGQSGQGTQAGTRKDAALGQGTCSSGSGSRAQAGKRKPSISETQMNALNAELKRTGVAMEAVQDRYQIHEPAQMPKELYDRVMSALSKTRTGGVA